MSRDKERLLPPYIPFKTFGGYVGYLHKAKVPPPKIDTSMMPGSMSGQVRSWLRTALRFLRLIDGEGTVSAEFVTLIETFDTESWKAALGGVVRSAYAPIVKNVDLKAGTAGQLNEAFRQVGMDGEQRVKAVRFFLAAMQDAGEQLSPHFTARGSKSIGRNRSQPRRKPERGNGQSDTDNGGAGGAEPERQAPGMTRWPIPIPGKANAVILVPENIAADDWEMINAVVTAYIALAEKARG